MMSAAWVVGGDQMRHEQEGSRHQMWHGYSFVRAMNSANNASLAAARICTTLYPSFLPPFRFFTRGLCILVWRLIMIQWDGVKIEEQKEVTGSSSPDRRK